MLVLFKIFFSTLFNLQICFSYPIVRKERDMFLRAFSTAHVNRRQCLISKEPRHVPLCAFVIYPSSLLILSHPCSYQNCSPLARWSYAFGVIYTKTKGAEMWTGLCRPVLSFITLKEPASPTWHGVGSTHRTMGGSERSASAPWNKETGIKRGHVICPKSHS